MKATDLTVAGFYWYFGADREWCIVRFDGDMEYGFTFSGSPCTYHASGMPGQFIGPIEYPPTQPIRLVLEEAGVEINPAGKTEREIIYKVGNTPANVGKTALLAFAEVIAKHLRIEATQDNSNRVTPPVPPREHPAAYIDPQFGYQEREPK